MANAWLLRATIPDEDPKKTVNLIPIFQKNNLIAIGWNDLGDLGGKTKDEIKQAVSDTYGLERIKLGNTYAVINLFVNDYISRSSCESCSFKGADRPSDITLGDFWGVWDLYPELCDDKGISAVITHTKKGRELLLSLENVVLKDVSVEEIAAQNGSLLYSSAGKPEREAILSMIREGRMAEVISMEIYKNKTPPKKPSLIKRGLQYIKRRLG